MPKKKVGRPKLPKSKHKKRNYEVEMRKAKARRKKDPSVLKAETARKRNRRKLMRQWKVKKGDKKDIHHKWGKLTVMSRSKNRWMREKSRLKGSKRNTKDWGK